MKPLIFISYARTDAQHAIKLERDLHAHGFATWRDIRNIDPNQVAGKGYYAS